MTIRLAKTPIRLTSGNMSVRLVPSLRAGFRMAEKWTLAEISKGLAELDFAMICGIITLGSEDILKGLQLLAKEVDSRRAIPRLQVHVPTIREFVSRSFGLVENDASNPGAVTGTPSEPNLIEDLTALFEFATGVLHWTPADTWAATPAEIIAAQRGHLAHLKQLYGSATDDKPASDPRDIPSETEVRANMAELRSKFGGSVVSAV